MLSQIMTKVFAIDSNKNNPIESRIVKIAEDITGIKSEQFFSNSRKPETLFIRYAIIHILYSQTSLSLNEIAAVIGGKHHTTIINSTRAASDLIATNNESFIQLINNIKKKLLL